MKFSQTQLRDTIGISVETFRHWKRVLPPFSERRKYSLGDVLAAGVLRRLTGQCGMRAGRLPDVSKAIVKVCNAGAWTSLQGKTLVIDVQKKTCALIKTAGTLPAQEIVVVCPLEGIMAQIQEALSRSAPSAAPHRLHFSQIAVSGTRAQRQSA